MRKSRRNKQRRQKMMLIIVTAFVIAGTGLGIGNLFASAHGSSQESPVLYKYYTSVNLEKGDTLWDIAKKYAHPDRISVKDYVNELRKMNNLSSDKICAGDYITIFYYDSEFK